MKGAITDRLKGTWRLNNRDRRVRVPTLTRYESQLIFMWLQCLQSKGGKSTDGTMIRQSE